MASVWHFEVWSGIEETQGIDQYHKQEQANNEKNVKSRLFIHFDYH